MRQVDRERRVLLGVAAGLGLPLHAGLVVLVGAVRMFDRGTIADPAGGAQWIVPSLLAGLFLTLVARTRTLAARVPLVLVFAAGWSVLTMGYALVLPAEGRLACLSLAIGLGALLACLGAGLGLAREVPS